MTKAKFWIGASLLSAVALAPSLADARHNRHHRHHWGLPYPISYLHNYGPGLQPGTFAYYDGPSTSLCRQGAAAYVGQDRRRYPCNEPGLGPSSRFARRSFLLPEIDDL